MFRHEKLSLVYIVGIVTPEPVNFLAVEGAGVNCRPKIEKIEVH